MTDSNYEHQPLWRPHAPTPYVTHEAIAPIHQKIGALEEGQRSAAIGVASLRAEMLTQFDRIEALLRREHDEAVAQRTRADNQADRSVTLNMRETIMFVIALIVAGMILGGRFGLDQLIGIQ